MLEEVLQCLLRRILSRCNFVMLLYQVQCVHKLIYVSRIFGVIRGSCIQNIPFLSIFRWKFRGLHAMFVIDDILILHTFISARPNSSQASFQSAMSSVLRSIFKIFYHAKCRSIARTYFSSLLIYGGTRWRSWLRHCATSQKVAGSISDGVTGFFHWHNPSGRTMALGSTQPLTEMSTRNVSWG